MQDKDLYSQILGVEKPWAIEDVKLDTEKQRVDIIVGWPRGEKVPCPTCGKLCEAYDHREERSWRHLDTCQMKTFLHCRVPRVNCSDHGVGTMNVSWAESNARFTKLFERFAIDLLKACQNREKGKELLRISWDEINHIMEKAVRRGLQRREAELIEYLGIDEKNFRKGHSYITVLSDLKGGRVIDVVEDRKEESADVLWGSLRDEQIAGVKAVAMDMWPAFINSTQKHLPNSDIVHDKFHIIGHLGKAVDKVRRRENKRLISGDIELLKGTKYLWLKNRVNWTGEEQSKFRELKGEQLDVGRAWNIKEMFNHFWGYSYEGSAKSFFKQWYFWATHSRLKPIIEVANMIKDHMANIFTYLKHHITNAVAEGLNSKIQQIKSVARGFRSFDNYRMAILFHCGKLALYPQ